MAGIRGTIDLFPADRTRPGGWISPAIMATADPRHRAVLWKVEPPPRVSESARSLLESGNGQVDVVFDGALTNAVELRAALGRSDRRLAGADDRTIVLALYEEYGHAFVHLLRGSFAIAVWDASRERLCLARDHLGTRALYYWRSGERFAFSTDLGSLLAMPGVSREPDTLGILDYLALGGTMPPRTMFRDIRKLAAGHLLFWQGGHVSVERYWAPVLSEVERSVPGQVVAQEWERLVECTLRDRPEGAVVCLDDGPGSRVLAAQFARIFKDPRTNFVAFGDSAGLAALTSARRLADRLGCRHVDRQVGLEDVTRGITDIVHRGGVIPGDEATALEESRFRRTASPSSLALRGDGATALLGARDLLGRPLTGTRREHRGSDHGWLERMFSKREIAGLWADAPVVPAWSEERESELARAAAGGGEDSTSRAIAVELGLMIPETRLAVLGSVAESTGTECRYPFLEQNLVNTMNSLGPRAKAGGWMDRGLWSKLVRRHLPAWARSTHAVRSFIFPPGELTVFARTLLEPERIRRAGYFEPSMIARLINEHRRNRVIAADRLWRILGVQLWHEQLIDGGSDR